VHRFRTTLVSGRKRPYSTWTFVVVPPRLAAEWGRGHRAVRGTIAGHAFRGAASTGEGVLRVAIRRDFLDATGLGRGDAVTVALELDAAPRTLRVPSELDTVLRDDREAAALFEALPPSHRRAWASYVGEAKLAETRVRRARKAPDGIRARAFPKG